MSLVPLSVNLSISFWCSSSVNLTKSIKDFFITLIGTVTGTGEERWGNVAVTLSQGWGKSMFKREYFSGIFIERGRNS